MAKIKLILSACLIGIPCRYNGKSQKQKLHLPEEIEIYPICPEVMGGLPIPRLPCEIQGEHVFNTAGKDCTKAFQKGAEKSLEIAKKRNCSLALLKESSPSCGVNFIYDGSFTGNKIPGQGITTQLLRENGVKVFSENEFAQLKKVIHPRSSTDKL
ncbi:MAG: DUF523 domain-containing protein [Tissierellia bacterium]|nr:DUF523 domain-containing protein [Tissierellia bacterium]